MQDSQEHQIYGLQAGVEASPTASTSSARYALASLAVRSMASLQNRRKFRCLKLRRYRSSTTHRYGPVPPLAGRGSRPCRCGRPCCPRRIACPLTSFTPWQEFEHLVICARLNTLMVCMNGSQNVGTDRQRLTQAHETTIGLQLGLRIGGYVHEDNVGVISVHASRCLDRRLFIKT